MRQPKTGLNWNEVLPRVLVDFCVVQAAGIAALICTVLWWVPELDWSRTLHHIRALETYYSTRFLPLSLVFPLVFAANGQYSRSRSYNFRYKWFLVLRGCVFATLLFLFLNVLVSRSEIMPRSSLLVFSLLVAGGTTGVRWLRDWVTTNSNQAPAPVQVPEAKAPVLVVGGAGYIGSSLCRKLLAAGESVRVLDSLVYGDGAIRELIGAANFELIEGDCRDIRNVVKAIRGVKSVVHLAAIVGDPACEQERQAALETNYAATRMIVEIAKGYGVQRFVFASSCSVYGATTFLMDENSEVKPVSLYGQTKVDSERALLEASGPDFQPTILRLATVFGAGYRQRFDLVVNLLTAKAYHEHVITIFNGEQWRPFIHVSDVAEGVMLMLSAPAKVVAGEVFNLGDSRMNFRLGEIGEKIRVAFPNTNVQRVDNDDARDYRVSFDKIRNMLGFQCRLTVDDGIQELKTCFEKGTIVDYKAALYNNQKFLQSTAVAKLDGVQSRVMAAFGSD